MSGRSLGGLLAVGKKNHPALGVRWSLCGRVFWAVFVQECLEGRFLPLQAGCRVGAGSGSSYSLLQVPWSELKSHLCYSRGKTSRPSRSSSHMGW